ncbi:hypothetical protein NVP1244A_180 [Vibrio phage 1.244.A._10N.261.54.C3]|nr:hypothetical protein NVP1244A_180 [Vibrio phage 1.244.A._10N.261.54.C3]AUR98808.1 hypothetical protein NVP1255O_180 [Vibrio phage 1.255.O._10N.286.45.F1]
MKSIVIVSCDTIPTEHTIEDITENLECESGLYCVIREVMDGHVTSEHVTLGEEITRGGGGIKYKATVVIGGESVPCILWERSDTSEFNFIVVDDKYAI